MDIYRVSFFGHRRIERLSPVADMLEDIVADLLRTKEYVEFYVGRYGEFDQAAASAVRRMQSSIGHSNSTMILVLPYMTAEFADNEKYFYDYYDEVEICPEAAEAHFKAAIGIRNKAVAERSDLVVCYTTRKSGGAYQAVRYADRLGKRVINIAEHINGDTQ